MFKTSLFCFKYQQIRTVGPIQLNLRFCYRKDYGQWKIFLFR